MSAHLIGGVLFTLAGVSCIWLVGWIYERTQGWMVLLVPIIAMIALALCVIGVTNLTLI